MRGLGNRTKVGKGASGFEDSWQNNPKAARVQVAGGQTVTPSGSRGQSPFGGGAEDRGWLGCPGARWVDAAVLPHHQSAPRSCSGRTECHAGAREAISSHHSLPSPGWSPKSASITQPFMSLPGCSAVAELNSPCHMCAESIHFWRVQPTLLQALIIINYEEKWEDALLLYLYEYVHVYLYTYKTKILCPNTWISQVQGKKTFVEMVSAKWTFFLIPWFQRKRARFVVPDVNYFFILFLTHLGLLVVTSWPGFFFVLLLLIFIFWVNFVTSDASWEKLLCRVSFFLLWQGKKKKKNVNMELHMLDMVIFACWVVCASRCWTGITRSLPQSVQGVSFAIVIFFLKLSLLQCWMTFVCISSIFKFKFILNNLNWYLMFKFMCCAQRMTAKQLSLKPFSFLKQTMLWNFTQRLNWLGLMSANAKVGVCASTHSSPHSLLWLSCAQCQLFAAFRIFCLLEVKSHTFLLTAHCEDIHWQGYPGWCRTDLAGLVSLKIISVLEEARVGIRKQRATWREGWIFGGPSWYVLF